MTGGLDMQVWTGHERMWAVPFAAVDETVRSHGDACLFGGVP